MALGGATAGTLIHRHWEASELKQSQRLSPQPVKSGCRGEVGKRTQTLMGHQSVPKP
jgi:hypothetical protein